MSLDYVNPMENLYKDFIAILRNVVVKYQKMADVYETTEMTSKANEYIDAYKKIDSFLTYGDYTEDELRSAGINDYKMIQACLESVHNVPVDNYDYQAHYEKYLSEKGIDKTDLSFITFRDMIISGAIPEERVYGTRYREKLLNARRKNIIEMYKEPNNYYRMLNGLPDVEVDPKYYYYVPSTITDSLSLSDKEIEDIQGIPLHLIQDYFNALDTVNGTHGNLIMALIEGTGFIDVVKNASRENKYIIYGGTYDGNVAHINDNTREALGIDKTHYSKTTTIVLMNNYASASFDSHGVGHFGYRVNKDVYYVVTSECTFAGLTLHKNDWLISDGEHWYMIDNSINIDGTSTGYTPYLNYLGSNRISIDVSRRAKNFEILRLDRNIVTNNTYDTFVDIYEQCRTYVMGTIYQYNFKSFFSYYENFTAMCIMLMAELHMITKQIAFEVRRNFFDVYALRMLYEAYNFPYNIDIDIDTQNLIVKNLNLIILNKSTNKVIYDIGHLLGFTDLKIYKYYLAKEHKMDSYGIPIFRTKKEFNTDTGLVETVPDYGAMYDIYFQKEELLEDDFIQSFNTKLNKVDYNEITGKDPYWWEDQNLVDMKNKAEYNFVEAKYLSLGISYKMTDIIFENMIMFKLLFEHSNEISDINLSLPKIIQGSNVPLFDVIILLICIISKSHKLTGEIVSYPSDIISVIDYLNNGEKRGVIDTFAFDFEYFTTEQSNKDLADVLRCISKSKYTYRKSNSGNDSPRYKVVAKYDPTETERQILYMDVLYDIGESFEVGDYVTPFRSIREDTAISIVEGLRQGKDIDEIAEELETDCNETISDDVFTFMKYIEILSIDSDASPEEKIATLNKMYSNIKNLYNWMNNKLRSETDLETYQAVRTLYQASFYATEIRDIFAVKWRDNNDELHERTAKNFFEYLHFKNPVLYSSIFTVNYDEEYDKFYRMKKDGEPVTKYIYCDSSYTKCESTTSGALLVVDDKDPPIVIYNTAQSTDVGALKVVDNKDPVITYSRADSTDVGALKVVDNDDPIITFATEIELKDVINKGIDPEIQVGEYVIKIVHQFDPATEIVKDDVTGITVNVGDYVTKTCITFDPNTMIRLSVIKEYVEDVKVNDYVLLDPDAIRVTSDMLINDWTYNNKVYTPVKLILPFARVGDFVKILTEIPTYVEYCQYVDAGLIDVRYDTVKDVDESETDNDTLSSILYYYANHIIARLKTILDDIDYGYAINGLSSLLHDLLVKLIKFVKSYTVDFISLDEIVKYDFRFENLMRLVDKEEYVQKSIVPEDRLNLAFTEGVHTTANISAGSKLNQYDLMRRAYMNIGEGESPLIFPCRKGIYASFALYEDSNHTMPHYLPTSHIHIYRFEVADEVTTTLDPDISVANSVYLEACVPSIEAAGEGLVHLPYENNNVIEEYNGIKFVYDDQYEFQPSAFDGLYLVYDDPTSSSMSLNYTDHTIHPDSYEFTVYIVCRSAEIEDTMINDSYESASLHIVTTPLLDIYTGAGIETIGIREYNVDSSTYDMSFAEGIITREYARDWHVIAISQKGNRTRVCVDGRFVLDKTFTNRASEFVNGSTVDFGVRFMSNSINGVNMRDVINGYSNYKCPIDYSRIIVGNKAHNSSELRENSKAIMASANLPYLG